MINGDCGFITNIFPDRQLFEITFDYGDKALIHADDMDIIQLAYAITVHKAQGSEYKAIILAQSLENSYMLQRTLLYTAVTRAKERICIIGQQAAINKAINDIRTSTRKTNLKNRLIETFQQDKYSFDNKEGEMHD